MSDYFFFFWMQERRSPEKETHFRLHPPTPEISPAQARLRDCSAEAQRGRAADVSPSGILLLHEAAAGSCSCCSVGWGDRSSAPRRPEPRAHLSRLFPGSTTELFSSVAVALRGVFFRPGASPCFLRRLIAYAPLQKPRLFSHFATEAKQ